MKPVMFRKVRIVQQGKRNVTSVVKKGHYAKCCKTKQKSEKRGNFQKHLPNKNKVNLVDSHDEHFAFIVNAEKQSCISVTIGGVQTDMIIDSGATCNLISGLEWERLKSSKVKCDSRKCTKKLFAYGSKTPLNVAGSFTAEISVGKPTHVAEFVVVEGGVQNLLAWFRDVFSGLGKLKNFQLEIPIDKTVKPVAQSVRPVPFSMREKINKKLQELLDMDIIEKAEGPTPLVSPIVVAPKPNGSFTAEISVGKTTHVAEFVVVEGGVQNLLGKDTALKLNMLRLGPELSEYVNSISRQDLLHQFRDVFSGLGKLKNFQLEIPIDKTVKPVAQRVRPVPFSMREKINKKLQEFLDMAIIEKAEGPTPWVSPIIVAPKPNGDIRLCVDMRQANQAIIRERHPIPAVDEILQNLNRSCIFSKLDLKLAFHQIE
ncbi:uncharacterized protein LOC134246834 [Saccostrea cucullata]|uniref:uncharacterized protein LOC134246834 n=1 Tax=Saccostrea cuccullata TaxID=36930 RepID=UPI002ED2EB18